MDVLSQLKPLPVVVKEFTVIFHGNTKNSPRQRTREAEAATVRFRSRKLRTEIHSPGTAGPARSLWEA